MFANHLFSSIPGFYLPISTSLLWCMCEHTCIHAYGFINISVCFLTYTEGSCWLLMTHLTNFWRGAVIQNGGCEHGNVGGAVQQHKTSGVCAQLEVLPIWVLWRVLHCTLPITKTNDMHVGKIATSRKTTLLQHEMTKWG